MSNLTTYSRDQQDEPVLQQNENHLQCLSFDNSSAMPITAGAAIAIAALYEATQAQAISFNYNCLRCSSFNKSVALLQELTNVGFLAQDRAIAEELAGLEQLQGAIK